MSKIVVTCGGHNTLRQLCDIYFNVYIFNFVELMRLMGYHSSGNGWWFSGMYIVTVRCSNTLAWFIDIMVKRGVYDNKSNHIDNC